MFYSELIWRHSSYAHARRAVMGDGPGCMLARLPLAYWPRICACTGA